MVSSMRRVAAISAGPRSPSPRGRRALSLLDLLGLSAISVYSPENISRQNARKSAFRGGSSHTAERQEASRTEASRTATMPSAQQQSRSPAVPNDLEAYWLPFTANRAFKAAPRLIARAKDMHYYTPDGRAVLDG